MSQRTILIFVDGLGWGEPDPRTNPCVTYGGRIFRLPIRPDQGAMTPLPSGGWARPIDAVLGVPGIPQSATGQTTLLTGINAQRLLGKHLTGFPNPKLQQVIKDHSLLKTLSENGHRACFLNAFRPLFWELSSEQQWRLSTTTVANLAAGLPFFTLEDLREERSVYQEITNGELLTRGFDVPLRTPTAAGRILADQARGYDFTLFEFFQSDRAGHSGQMEPCEQVLSQLDEFMRAVLESLVGDLAVETLVILTSDHGNLEDVSTRHHTTNPIPLMVWGRGAADFVAGVTQLDEVAPAILTRHPA